MPTIFSVNLVFVCRCTCCLKKHAKSNHLSIVCFWENRQCIITLSEVCMVVFRIVVWLWWHFCKVWMGWMCKQHLAVIPKLCCYNLLSVSGEFYIFIHMLKCYVFSFSWEINNSRIYILMAAAGGKHPWSCLFYQLSLFFLSLERCGNFVSTRKGHLNTSKGSFLLVLWQYRHHEFDMSNIE